MSTPLLVSLIWPPQFRLVLRFAFLASFSAAQGAPSGTLAKQRAMEVREPTAADALDPVSALRQEIARHDQLYYRDAATEIGDSEYDALARQLVELEKTLPAARVQPRRVGDDRSGLFPPYRHRERMLSLEKVYTDAEVDAFHARMARLCGPEEVDYVVEPKFDGLAISVTYEHGRLIRATTRGNGVEGEDVTANARQIGNLPPQLLSVAEDGSNHPVPDVIELRGEVYIAFSDFSRMNAERDDAGESRFANPRNLAAGTLRQTDPRQICDRNLQVVFFGTGACEPRSALPATQRGLHGRIKAWGLPGVAEFWTGRGGTGLRRALEALGRARPDFPFPTDGAVVKLDSLALQREAGSGETAPRWAIAYKFAPERAETRVHAITIQVGRSGVLTPVAELIPVRLAGTTVSRATLHNLDEIARKDIRVDDTVYVEKAGEIIPAITGVNIQRRPVGTQPFAFPKGCPDCGSSVTRREGEVAVRCVNPSCPAQLRRRLEHFASKGCVDIPGLGPATIEGLVAGGAVKKLSDLYQLRREDFIALGKNGAKSADAVIAAIEASKRAELWRFVNGLGIPQVGPVAARDLARQFGSLAALAAITPAETAARQIQRAALGPDPALRAATAHFAEPENGAVVVELLAAGVRPTAPPMDEAKPGVAGRMFALTGTLPTLTRADATAQILASGGKVVGTVSRSTHYVVAGTDPGTKLEQARTLGIKVIDEAELRRMLAGQ